MFNNYHNNQKLQINAISGTLIKNYKDSFILRFHYKSLMSESLFSENPTLQRYGKNDEKIVIIQAMIIPNDYMLCEVMWKEDFDKLFFIEDEQ